MKTKKEITFQAHIQSYGYKTTIFFPIGSRAVIAHNQPKGKDGLPQYWLMPKSGLGIKGLRHYANTIGFLVNKSEII